MAGGEEQPDNQGPSGWQYRPEGNAGAPGVGPPDSHADMPTDGADDAGVVEWTASEFIAHQKSGLWYLTFVLCAAIISAVVYIVTRDYVSAGAVVLVCVIAGIAAVRKPRVLPYRLDRSGLSIGQRFHPYGEFRSFAVVNEQTFASVTLLPTKRFSLPISVYFAPEDEQRITEVIGQHLPLQPGEIDIIDRLLRNLHF